MKQVIAVLGALFILVGPIGAAQAENENRECPVGFVNGLSLDDEFGEGSAQMTRCLDQRKKVRLLIQINQSCASPPVNGVCPRAYALGNIRNAINDYEVTHGMTMGEDFEVAAVVHSGGGMLMVKDEVLKAHNKGSNPFEGDVRALLDEGVNFYFCQNTVRGYIRNGTLTAGHATEQLVDGVQYTTAGITAIADFQSNGWQYVQP